MRFFHFSKIDLEKEFSTQKIPELKKYSSPYKPVGLWLSIEKNNNGWRNFCIREKFRCETLTNCYEIGIYENTNFLTIASREDLINFSKKYSIKKELIDTIDFEKLYEDYDGIIFFPYKRDYAYSENFNEHFWYTTVDCDSSCVWNLSKIQKITPIYKNLTLNQIKKFKIV